MAITRFVLAVHCHQPVGNFDWIFEEAYSKAYLPFLQALQRHPPVRAVIHYSGILLEWFKAEHPEFLRQLQGLVRGGQVEMMGGGFCEPILTMIPERDAVGQLEEMNRTLKRLQLGTPTGAWLAERVWEPQLPSLFAQAGIRYTVVDDHHLAQAGVGAEDRFGYYLTEDRGAALALFPSSKTLRYQVPFKPVSEVMETLGRCRSERPQAVVLADDGEKFGLWPGTHDWVYGQGWLEQFFSALEASQDWLQCVTFQECLEQLPPLGKVVVPPGSYEEMMHWSGGSFRNFLLKYPEADAMHKKMLWVSKKLESVSVDTGHRTRLLTQARKHLYLAQDNDAYWHGIFGGLYLPHLRRGLYRHLLAADRLLGEMEGKGNWLEAESLDINADRKEEILLRSRGMSLGLEPGRGGQLVEASDKASGLNLLDTLGRRPEPYHEKLRQRVPVGQAPPEADPPWAGSASGPMSIHERQEVQGMDLADALVYDSCSRRAGLMDHLFSLESQVEALARGQAEDLGDFLEAPYQGRIRRGRGRVEAVLSREGRIRLGGADHPLRLEKRVSLSSKERGFSVRYRLSNRSEIRLEFLFGSELNLNLKDAHVNRIGEAEGIERFSVTDPALRLKADWDFGLPTRLWYFPVETVSDSEKGMERNFQGVSLTFLWPVALEPGASWQVQWQFKVES